MMQSVRRAGMQSVRSALRNNAEKMQMARSFSEAPKAAEEEVPAGVYRPPTQQEYLQYNTTAATPGFAEDIVTPTDPVPAEPEGAMKGWEGYVNYVPEEHQSRKVRLFKKSKSANEMDDSSAKYWSLTIDRRANWTNQVMKYASTGDPLGATGLQNMKFDKLEDAKGFCERQGWSYEVEEPLTVVSQEGKKQYAQNFLNYHVRTRREKMPPNELLNTQFFHREGRKSTWVNLKHTAFGKVPSKVVSGTQWTDPHPNNHKATDWYISALEHKQELARKLGK